MLNQLKKWYHSYLFQIGLSLVTLILVSNIVLVILLDINMSKKMKEIHLAKHQQGAEASFFVLEPRLYDLIDKLARLSQTYPQLEQELVNHGDDYLDTSESFTSLFYIDEKTRQTKWLSGMVNHLEQDVMDGTAIKRAFSGEYSLSGRINYQNQQYVIIAGPVIEKGNVEGVLGGVVSLNHSTILQGSLKPMENDSIIYLVDEKGAVLGTNSPVVQSYSVDPEVYSHLRRGKTDIGNYDDGEYLYSIYRLENLDWSVIVQTPNDQIYEAVREVRKYNFFVLIIILLVGIILTSIISDRINKPISELISEIRTLKDKKRPHQVSKKGNTEIDTLVQAYNDFSKEMYEEQQKRLIQQNMLLQNEKLAIMGRLSAGIIHEIRNPLTPVKGFLQLILNSKSIAQEEKRYVELALAELERANALVNSLLDISRPEKEKKTEHPINMKELIEQVIILVEANLYGKNIDFHYKLPKKEVIVWGNRDGLIQVIYNLCNNAIEAMEEKGGRLELDLIGDECTCCITVRDSGEGIDETALKDITKPFYTTKKTGTGLGLFMTKEIIEEHNGHLEITSEVEQGTQATVTLPTYCGNGEWE